MLAVLCMTIVIFYIIALFYICSKTEVSSQGESQQSCSNEAIASDYSTSKAPEPETLVKDVTYDFVTLEVRDESAVYADLVRH